MLGAGFVTKPTLDILSEAGIKVTVGTYCICLGQALCDDSSASCASLSPLCIHIYEALQLVTS